MMTWWWWVVAPYLCSCLFACPLRIDPYYLTTATNRQTTINVTTTTTTCVVSKFPNQYFRTRGLALHISLIVPVRFHALNLRIRARAHVNDLHDYDDAVVVVFRCLVKAQTLENPHELDCSIKTRPNALIMKLHVVSMFAAAILMSSWVWTRASLDNFWRLWCKCVLCVHVCVRTTCVFYS